MPDLTIAFDPGSSLGKVFFTLKTFQPELLLMEPEVAQVPQRSLEAYEEGKIGTPAPENAAWVEYRGQCRAVGFLAQDRFYADLKLEDPKFELALYKTLAVVGAIAQQKSLPNGASLLLGVLLPYGEYEDRKVFERLITEALAGFRFRGEERSFELINFVCRPEGFGLLSRGRTPGSSLRDRVIAVVMLGYRNTSVLVMNRGVMTQGETADLGFCKLVAMVQRLTSGQKPLKLAAAISKAGPKISAKALAHLARVSDSALRDEEIAQIREAIAAARAEYWLMLGDWLRKRIPLEVDEVMLAGGTAYYWQRELNALFPQAEISWCTRLEEQITQTYVSKVSEKGLNFRLTDAYGLFFYLCGTPELQASARVASHA